MMKRIVTVMVISGLTGWAPAAFAWTPSFTGYVPTDFSSSQPGVIMADDTVGDVGIPSTISTVSGWDVDGLSLYYDPFTDTLYVGVFTPTVGNNKVIFGDADNDGDPGRTSTTLDDAGGTDNPDLSGTEAFTFYIDTNRDGTPDVIAGVSDDITKDITGFTVANYKVGTAIKQSYRGFGTDLTQNKGVLPVSPSAAKPHLEFTIAKFSTLPNMPAFNRYLSLPTVHLGMYAGSQDDSGIGEDYIPAATRMVENFSLPSPSGTLSGDVFYDTVTVNGTRDTTETGLAGATLSLYGDTDKNGTSETQTLTAGSDGRFSLTGLAAGSYTVTLQGVPFGYKVVPQTAQTLTLNPYETSSLKFALQKADTDADGIPDLLEGQADTDGDGKPDYQDPDSDGDGIPDGTEDKDKDGTQDPGETDGKNPDSDDDGLPDGVEDLDKDGKLDPGEMDPLDEDSDDDGLIDGLEDLDQNGEWDPGETNPLDDDTDDDGLLDFTEDPNGNGQLDPGETDPLDDDSDDDGLSDGTESGLTTPEGNDTAPGPFTPDGDPATTTDPTDADSDDDGLTDGNEDADGDGKVDAGEASPNSPDSDGDGLPDGLEAGLTSPQTPDTNQGVGNFIPDGGPGSVTNPTSSDTDGDGLPDGVEDANHNGNVDPGETDPTNPDFDGDGLVDGLEDANHNGKVDPGETNPMDADSDDDGLTDGAEDKDKDGVTDPTETSPTLADTDGDDVQDGTEQGLTSAQTPATDPQVFQPDTDPSTTTSPLDDDTDDDGLMDGTEDGNGDGGQDAGEPDPRDPDSDDDGLTDGLESGLTTPEGTGTNLGASSFQPDQDPLTTTDPTDADTDDDGLMDSTEDINADGAVNPGETKPQEPDTDDDGLTDGLESGLAEPETPDTDLEAGQFTPDEDEGATTTSPIQADTDQGGIEDGAEDVNGNGVVDEGEINPNYKPDDVDSDGDGAPDVTEAYYGSDPQDPDSDDDGILDGPDGYTDPDEDGQVNSLDPDADDDLIPDGVEDKDHDGTVDPGETDPLDPDTDDGGAPDGYEDVNHNGVQDVGETDPLDPSDDTDSDGDGVPDLVEDHFGSDPNDQDSDDDGILDGVDGYSDPDGDGIVNAEDPDADGDGIGDDLEVGDPEQPVDTDEDGKPDYLDTDKDNDLIPDGLEDKDHDGSVDPGETDPLNPDTDGGGVPDGSEDLNHNGQQDEGEGNPLDPSDDQDRDGDGLPDAAEASCGTDPANPDSDGDTIPDGTDGCMDSDGDGMVNALDLDSDDDGLPDSLEAGADPTHPADSNDDGLQDYVDPDQDDDGLLDGIEDRNHNGTVDTGETDPRDADTDDGGVPDGAEDANHNGQVDEGETDPLNPVDDTDSDGDGLPDSVEETYGTNPLDPDTDDDGIYDGVEGVSDADGDGKVNALDLDSDDDGLPDSLEAGATPNQPADVNQDGIPDYLDDDLDNDGQLDGLEDRNHNGKVDTGETDPLDPDSDEDGLTDGQEDADHDGELDDNETDPTDPDTDGDGLPDGDEVPGDHDGDGKVNARDDDADDDGLPDGLEAGLLGDSDPDTTTDPLDADSDDDGLLDGEEDANENGKVDGDETNPRAVDTDGDGLQDGLELGVSEASSPDTNPAVFVPDADPSTTTNPLDVDTDDGTVSDGVEDANHNGRIDEGETDPNLAADDVPVPDENLTLRGGGGCSTGGSAGNASLWGLALLVLPFFRRLRRRQTGLAALTVGLGAIPALASNSASAQEDSTVATSGLEVQQFQPSPDASSLFSTQIGRTQGPLVPYVGLWLNYASDPLVFFKDGEEYLHVLDHAMAADVVGGLGLGERMDFSFGLPVVLDQGGEETNLTSMPTARAWGDLRLNAKFRLTDGAKGPRLAIVPTLFLPTGGDNSFAGSGELNAALTLVADQAIGKKGTLALNLGYRLRPTPFQLADLTVDDQIFYRLGLSWETNPSTTLLAEVFGSKVVQGSAANINQVPLELLLGARKRLPSGLALSLGAGAGLLGGYGVPDYRVLLGVAYNPDPSRDSDDDGIVDKDDQCRLIKEDRDGFQDLDGCPDPDNDQDGILDVTDKCPNDPEDRDSFQDEDGCPDPDNDADGVLDVADKCPTEKEDRDGFQDADGCPDPDNDQDGILDVADKCPNDPEDKDKFQDEDGCPDPDNDADGILDTADKCPNDAEDKDGFEDEDGCLDPDNDADGILDGSDKCPTQPETVNQHEDDDGCPDSKAAEKVVVQDNKLILLEKIYFKTDSAVIESRSFDILNQAIQVFKENPQMKVRIEGHTDDVASDEYNLSLSQRRADSVRQYMLDKGKLEAARFEAVGKGEREPAVPNDTPDNRSKNRRIEWIILSR